MVEWFVDRQRPALERAALLLMGVYLFVLNLQSVVTVRESVFFLALACAALLMLRNRSFGLPPLRLLFAAWLVLSLLSVSVSADPWSSLAEVKKEIVYPVLAFWLFYAMTRKLDDYSFLSAFVLTSAAVVAAVSAYIYLVHGMRFKALEPQGLLYGERSYFSFFLLASAAVSVGVAISWQRRPRLGVCALAMVPMAIAGIYFARLRGGYLAAAAAVCLLLVYTNVVGRSFKRKAVVIAIIVLIALPVPAMMARRNLDVTIGPGMIRSYMESIKKEERWAIWRASISSMSERPVLGYGFGNKEIYIPGFRVENIYPHNIFLSYGVMTGIAGPLVVFAIFVRLFMLLNSAFLRARAAGAPAYGVALSGIMLLAIFVILNMTEDVMTRHTGQFFWALMGMTLGSLRGSGGELYA